MVFLSCSLFADSFVSEEGFPPPWKATISGLTQLAGDKDSCTTSLEPQGKGDIQYIGVLVAAAAAATAAAFLRHWLGALHTP